MTAKSHSRGLVNFMEETRNTVKYTTSICFIYSLEALIEKVERKAFRAAGDQRPFRLSQIEKGEK